MLKSVIARTAFPLPPSGLPVCARGMRFDRSATLRTTSVSLVIVAACSSDPAVAPAVDAGSALDVATVVDAPAADRSTTTDAPAADAGITTDRGAATDSGTATDAGSASTDTGSAVDATGAVDAGARDVATVTDTGASTDVGSTADTGTSSATVSMLATDQCFTFATGTAMASGSTLCGDMVALTGANVDLQSPDGPDAMGGFCELPGTFTALASVPSSYASCAWSAYVEGALGLANHGLVVRDAAHVHHYRVRVVSNTLPRLVFEYARID